MNKIAEKFAVGGFVGLSVVAIIVMKLTGLVLSLSTVGAVVAWLAGIVGVAGAAPIAAALASVALKAALVFALELLVLVFAYLWLEKN